MMENGKYQKTIFSLDREGGIRGQNDLKTYITHFYKKLCGEPKIYRFSINEEWTKCGDK
jgi:hypothetical protein